MSVSKVMNAVKFSDKSFFFYYRCFFLIWCTGLDYSWLHRFEFLFLM